MGYEARFTGEIGIDPPLTWAELDGDDSPVHTLRDLRVSTHEEVTSTATARMSVITGRAVTAAFGTFAGYGMKEELQSLVDAFGAGRFTGHIEAVGEEGDRWRLAVRDGEAVQVYPQITWPEEAGTEPRFGQLDETGRPGDGYTMWNIAAYLPDGREAEVSEFLFAAGIGVYRMWKVER